MEYRPASTLGDEQCRTCEPHVDLDNQLHTATCTGRVRDGDPCGAREDCISGLCVEATNEGASSVPIGRRPDHRSTVVGAS